MHQVAPESAKRLTDWKNEPTVTLLKEDLEMSRSTHDEQSRKVIEWNELRDVSGSQAVKKRKNRSSVQPKLIRRQAEWRYPALTEPFLSSKNLFTIKPSSFEDAQAARQTGILLNWQFRTKMRRVAFIDEYVRSAVDDGTVVVRVGWERKTKEVPSKTPVFGYTEAQDPAYIEQITQALKIKTENPQGFAELDDTIQAAVDYYLETGIIVYVSVVDVLDTTETKILVNKPIVDVISPENIYVDPSCGTDYEKALFVIYSFETSKADLMKDGRYSNLDIVNWQGATVLNEPDHVTKTPNDTNFKDELRKRVVAYEYWGFWDIHDTGELVPVVATWVGNVMVRCELNPFPDQKIPFVFVPYSPVRNQVWGEPDAEVLGDNQKISGAIMRGIIDLLGRSANSQTGTAKGFLDVTNKRRFENGDDYEFNPQNGDPRLSLFQHQYPELPASALNVLAMQNNEAEAMTGVKAFSGGLSGQTYGEVAAGIRGLLDAASKRETSILRRLAEGMTQIGTKIAKMNAVFLSEEEIVNVTNESFVVIRREELEGSYDIIVDIATAEVDEAQAQDIAYMLQTMGPDMDPSVSRELLAQIADLRRMHALAHWLRNFQPQVDPLAQKRVELELAKLEAEIAKLQSEAEENRAQAAKFKAEADKKTLEFVEQETGTTHERNMQAQGAQAQANQNLEVTKALLKTTKPEERQPDVREAIGFNAISDRIQGVL